LTIVLSVLLSFLFWPLCCLLNLHIKLKIEWHDSH
jgi:hypothetical protein